jgi:sulfate transport system permease protein
MIPYATEITPQLIIIKLEGFDYVGAAGLGLAMLVMSFVIVATVNLAQRFAGKRLGVA